MLQRKMKEQSGQSRNGLESEVRMEEHTMKQVFMEFVIPDIVYKDYEKILQGFLAEISALHGLTYDSIQVREFDVDEIPF